MATNYKNIVITPNRDTDAANVPVIRFSGGDATLNTDINLRVYTTQSGTLSFEGSAGQLFSITNDLTNTIFSVNDVSGIPSLEVNANGQISLAPFGGNVVFGNTSTIYAPIFYDSANTNYYLDPASTSRLNVLQFASGATNGPYFNYGNNQQNLYLRGSSGTDIGISFFDSSNNWRMQLYAGAGTYGFLNSNWGLWDLQKFSGGKLYLNNQGTYYIDTSEIYYNRVYGVTDIRSPIFYDNNDTTYYVDPASTSDAAVRIRGGAYFGPNVSWSEYLYVGGNGRVGTSATVAVTNGNLHLDSKDGFTTYLNWYSQQNIYTGTSAFLGLGNNTASHRLHVHGTGLATTDFRAPIFYDSNNTAYYVDPASGSNIKRLFVDTTNVDPSEVNGAALGNIYEPTTSWSAPGIAFGSGAGSHGAIGYGSGLMYFASENGSDNTLNSRMTLTNGGILTVNGDVRTPIFYDSDNTAYYVDPALTSVLNSVYVYGGFGGVNATSNYYDAAIEVREYGFGGTQTDSWAYAPRIGFHWSGRVASQIGMASSGRISILNNPGNGYEAFECGNFFAPIFYDSNNTGYYVDPASTSNLNIVNAVDFNSTSDIRFKRDINKIKNALDKVNQLNGYTFTLTETNQKAAGLIAQEVEKVLPEAVRGTEHKKMLAYDNVIGLLVEAIKEQNKKIEHLEMMINKTPN